jgi:curli biogenesis system outer membrane secretion channel CsgG
MKFLKSCFIAALALCLIFEGSAAAADKIRLGVLKFNSKAEGVSDKQAEIITDIFTGTLSGSKTISVHERVELDKIGEELRLGQSGLIDPSTAAEIGKLAGLQYILLGSVTNLSQKEEVFNLPIKGFNFTSVTHEATATIDIRIVDVETTEIRMALKESGFASDSSGGITYKGGGVVDAEFGGLKASAISAAAYRLGREIREKLGGEYSYVVGGGGSEFIIDAGSNMGVNEGEIFLVYSDGKTITGIGGETIGKEKIPLAVLKVKKVEDGHSICGVAEPTRGSVIMRGDKIEPISASEAKKIKSPSSRPTPSAYDETFNAIFNDDESGGADSSRQEGQKKPAEPVTATVIEGFDPNQSTDSKVIKTYALTGTDKNTLGIKHRGAYSLYSQKKYKNAFEAFVVLVEEYPANYLSAYWAGVSAAQLKSYKEAIKWFDRALEINPDYEPAKKARAAAEGKLP